MLVKTKKMDLGLERNIAIGMVGDDDFARAFKASGVTMRFKSTYIRKVCEWAGEYCRTYDEAPKAHIKDIFQGKVSRKELDETEVELIGSLLESISLEAQRKKFNYKYVLDEALQYFKVNAYAEFHKKMKTALESKDVDAMDELMAEYHKTASMDIIAKAVDPFRDVEAIRRAFDVDNKPLFTLRGSIGRLMNKQFIREGLICVQAPEKRGKTWFLLELAYRALMARCNVAVFEVGDMSESQIVRRFQIRLAGKSDDPDYCGKIFVPCADCALNQKGECDLSASKGSVYDDDGEMLPFDKAPKSYVPCSKCRGDKEGKWSPAVWGTYVDVGDKPLTWQEAAKKSRRLHQWITGRALRTFTYPNSSINVEGINAALDMEESATGWIPDVIFIDYADILDRERKCKDDRPQNDTWKALRALSQRRRCLVVSATQSDANSYDAPTQKLKNFSEDKRKYAHTTVTYSLNQTDSEKRFGMLRIGVLVQREGKFTSESIVTVLQCLERGRFYIDSL